MGGQPLEGVGKFKYLGRVLSKSDSDWKKICRNLTKTSAGDASVKSCGGKEQM